MPQRKRQTVTTKWRTRESCVNFCLTDNFCGSPFAWRDLVDLFKEGSDPNGIRTHF
jgi:hypothetical protein